jgi:hypothetical protein
VESRAADQKLVKTASDNGLDDPGKSCMPSTRAAE